MKAITLRGGSPADIKKKLEDCLATGYRPTLGIVFLSVKQDRDALCSLLHEAGIRIFGATTSGEFINSEISEGGIVLLLLDLPPDYFETVFFETKDVGEYEAARQLGAAGKERFAQAAFLIASGWAREQKQLDYEEIIKGVEDGYEGEAVIFGGVAGDELTLTGPVVFTNDRHSVSGLAAIILDQDKVDVQGIATCGWKPIGITKTITKSEGNIVYTIDDEPALDLVLRFLGLSVENLRTIAGPVVDLGAYYPLQVQRKDGPPVMRTAQLGNLEDRSLFCAGNIPQGAGIRFSLPPDFDVIDTVVEECRNLHPTERPEADAVIMFSCVARYLSFGALAGEELEQVSQVWKAPFIGFFSYGEFGKSRGGKHEFHNNTCCVVTLKERE